jgi:FdhD protein
VKLDKIESPRYGAISASCGVCGKTSLESIRNSYPDIQSDCQIERSILLSLPDRLRESQVVFEKTGGLHSSGLFDKTGNLVCLREDVGRHNALDKAIGFALLNDIWPLENHILMVSGRVSFEIIQKALAARIPIVAAVSAPSSLAISVARECGITLVGFLRNPTMNVYSHPHRISG